VSGRRWTDCPESNMADDLHPTVAACNRRSFCDATFAAAERRSHVIGVLLERVHASEQHAGPLQGCRPCRRLMEEAGDPGRTHGHRAT
jgi:hypothetical protein